MIITKDPDYLCIVNTETWFITINKGHPTSGIGNLKDFLAFYRPTDDWQLLI
jgi:hypothetical protein